MCIMPSAAPTTSVTATSDRSDESRKRSWCPAACATCAALPLSNEGDTTNATSATIGPTTMHQPATVLRKWCESEKPMRPPLVPDFDLAPDLHRLRDDRYKLGRRLQSRPAWEEENQCAG